MRSWRSRGGPLSWPEAARPSPPSSLPSMAGLYATIPQVERAVAVHLCPRNAATWRNRPELCPAVLGGTAADRGDPPHPTPAWRTDHRCPGLSLPGAVSVQEVDEAALTRATRRCWSLLFLRRQREQRRSFPRRGAGRRILCFFLFLFRGTLFLKERAMARHMASAAAVTPLRLLHMRPLQHWLHSQVPRWAWVLMAQ